MYGIGDEVLPGLGKLIEECGELAQVLGKLIATKGAAQHWDGTNLRDRLHEELADVLAACTFLIERNGLDRDRIVKRAERKLAQFHAWDAQQRGRSAPGSDQK